MIKFRPFFKKSNTVNEERKLTLWNKLTSLEFTPPEIILLKFKHSVF